MDVKEAIEPAAPRSKSGVMPRDNAERVIAGASKASGSKPSGVCDEPAIAKRVHLRKD